MKSLYLLVDLGAMLVPFLFSFHPRLKFYVRFRAAFLAIFCVGIPFVVWDVVFTEAGVWGFNERYLLGVNVFGLPLEEVLFFVCIPFSCLFTFHCLNVLKFPRPTPEKAGRMILFAGVLFILIGVFSATKLYTFWTLTVSGLIMAYVGFRKRPYLALFLVSYLLLLIPFFVVNGILTGTGPDEAIVWYNNEENSGIRVLTIPVEDFVYGLLLILLNVALFEFFKGRERSEIT